MKPNQVVYVKRVGNAARGLEESKLVTEEVIEKVGNKYFYLKGIGWGRVKFSIEEMHDISDYSNNYQVYLSQEEIELEKEYYQKLSDIRRFFREYGRINVSLEQLRSIHKIIFESQKEESE